MPTTNVPKPITHASHTITVESYTDVDGCHKFCTSWNGQTRHYLADEWEETSIAEALKNLLDLIAE